ncbi:MAG: hypothetical protein LWW93_13155 [Hyphomicrobiales bacterium]|nr:hypothetical protein [Hyphomicrobiales bacterium]
MNDRSLVEKLRHLVGVDTAIIVDDEHRPTTLSFHRHDRVSDGLVREAIARARQSHPDQLDALRDVFVDFRDGLGATRRRVDM